MSTGSKLTALPGSPLDAARGGLELCVHCGFCLQACPTYLSLENENDSPRGRLVLMQGFLDGDITLDDEAANTHIDQCLGCRGCETACPSGVPFGHLLEATRATLRDTHTPSVFARGIVTVFSTPWLLRPLMWGARLVRDSGLAALLAKLPGRAGAPFLMLTATTPGPFSLTRHAQGASRETPNGGTAAVELRDAEWVPGVQSMERETHVTAPAETPSDNAAILFEGCVMRELFGHVHLATRMTMERNGYEFGTAPSQGCCGALHAHSGDDARARTLAKRNIVAFETSGAAWIAVNAAGCGAMLREYSQLLAGESDWAPRARAFSARVRDVTELLAARGPTPTAAMNIRVAWDAPCHLQHAQRVVTPPLAVLDAIPGLQLVQNPDSDRCCGAAGIYNLVHPEISESILTPKVTELIGANVSAIATGNPGCMMQIAAGLARAGSGIPVVHPVELLARAYRGEGAPDAG